MRRCSRCRTIAGTLRGSWITDAREAVREARYGRAHKILTATELRKKKKKKTSVTFTCFRKRFYVRCWWRRDVSKKRAELLLCSHNTTRHCQALQILLTQMLFARLCKLDPTHLVTTTTINNLPAKSACLDTPVLLQIEAVSRNCNTIYFRIELHVKPETNIKVIISWQNLKVP